MKQKQEKRHKQNRVGASRPGAGPGGVGTQP